MTRLFVLILLFTPALSHALPAFPGAEGMGASSVGGRGGSVCVVDTLSDKGEDGQTFRECVTQTGARYVVFSVSGTIWLESRLTIDNDYITIAGETSPGGICIAGYMMTFDGVHDVIVRHLRFRPGPLYETPGGTGYAAVNILGGSALNNADGKADAGTDPAHNIIFDHCSFSWANDTNVNVGYDAYDITFSWCSFTEPLYAAGHDDGDAHNLGLLFWGKHNSTPHGFTVHHSFFAHAYYRVPEINFHGFLDQTNNVVYGSVVTQASGIVPVNDGGTIKRPTMNMVNCYMDVRNGETSKDARNVLAIKTGLSPYNMVYMTGNVQSTMGADTPAWNAGDYDSSWGAGLLSTDWQQSSKFPTRDITVTASEMNTTYAEYIVNHAGANRVQSRSSLSYDSVDLTMQVNYKQGSGSWRYANTLDERSDWPVFPTPPPPMDSDLDGMADDWEKTAFGDLSQPATGDYNSDGYDNIENYFHFLTSDGVENKSSILKILMHGISIKGKDNQ